MDVVVLDDAEMNNLLVTAALRPLEDVCLHAFTRPVDALDFTVRNRATIGLFIVDYDMPEMDGIAFAQMVRADAALHHTPIIMVTSTDQRAVRRSALEAGVTDFVTKPFDPHEIRARARNLLALEMALRREHDRAAWLEQEVAKAIVQIEDREREIVTRLVITTESRDKETGLHVQRVSAYVELMARALGLGPRSSRLFALASTMHDLGKVAVPDAILMKPGPLTTEERVTMQAHAEAGHSMLTGSDMESLNIAAQIALTHHERWDGTGYPRRLAADDIPLAGRITAVADTFDALVSDRPYKHAWTYDAARNYLIEQSGHHFDPHCVSAFLDNWTAVVAIAKAKDSAALDLSSLIPAPELAMHRPAILP